MEYTTLLFEVRDSIAHVTLNRPEAANSITVDTARDLMHATIECDQNPTIRAVVLSGAGVTFCTGGDLKAFAAQGKRLPHYLKETTAYLHAAVSLLTRMAPPVIAAVNGFAAGAGMGLACACDITVAAESARFTMSYTRVGLTPDAASTYFLSRILGVKRATELTLTNRVLSAQEALDWGLVTCVVAEADLFVRADAIAAQLAASAPKATGASKRLLHSGWTETLETQMEYESRTIADMAGLSDADEGITAFLEKRTPKFKGL